jgi:alkylation response protein AidB-like acyl-CoA dehydrogenase
LGEAGAFAAHLPQGGRDYPAAIAAIEAISRECGATGFLAWCQDVCGLYLAESANPALGGPLLAAHAAGQGFGGTALSNPMKAFAGIETFLLRAVRVPGGYRVNGALPWVSHIAEGQYCGAVATVLDAEGARSHEVMFLLRFDGRARRRRCPAFAGMEGTSTWGGQLTDFAIGPEDIIADPALPFIRRITAGFILLQCGMALGIADASIAAMRGAEKSFGHVNAYLPDRPEVLAPRLAALRARVMRLAAHPFETARAHLIDVLEARAEGAELALCAAQSALLHQGARGYLSSDAAQRRLREAQFVAIVTPAIKHLRWEIARLSREMNHAAA